MANIFKTTDSGGLVGMLRDFALAIRQFFGTKSEMDVVATALTDLDNRKIEASDIPASLPANGGNADTVDGEHASAFAHIGAHNNLTASGNEFTFASNEFSGAIWLNYRTAGGANGNITEYKFGNGKGGELGTAIHSGNYNSYSPTLTGTGASGTWGINISGNAATASNVAWNGVTNKPSSFTPSSHTHTKSEITDFPTSLPANGGNADTVDGYHAADFVLKTTHDEHESVIAEALSDLDSRKVDIEDIPTSLPANGGNADTSDYAKYLRGRSPNGNYYEPESVNCNIIAEWNTKSDNRWYLKSDLSQCRVGYADKVDWLGIDNKPSSFTPSTHTHTTSEITNFPTIGNGALHIKVNDTELTPEGGIFTANKGGDSTINIPVPTAESIEQSTLNKLGDKAVFKDTFASELAKEMAEVTSKQNPNKVLKFKFTNPENTLECTPDILSFNYNKVDGYYRLNIKGWFFMRGFNFAAQKGQKTYNPELYHALYGNINNSKFSSEKTGVVVFRLTDQQASSTTASGPLAFEIAVFVKSLSNDYNDGIYGELYIKQFYS